MALNHESFGITSSQLGRSTNLHTILHHKEQTNKQTTGFEVFENQLKIW